MEKKTPFSGLFIIEELLGRDKNIMAVPSLLPRLDNPIRP